MKPTKLPETGLRSKRQLTDETSTVTKQCEPRARMPITMAKPGHDLQRLVRVIETAVANNPNIEIQSPAMLRDKDTGSAREHDVLIRFGKDHHAILLALECRDRSREVGVDEVEAFHSKCQRTGVSRGIIVSSKGFARTAVTKAGSFNIGCLTLIEAEAFNWCLAPGATLIKRSIHSVLLSVEAVEKAEIKSVHLADGTEIERDLMLSNARYLVDAKLAPEKGNEPGKHNHIFGLAVEPAARPYVITRDGRKLEIQKWALKVGVTVVHEFCPFELRKYFDVAKGTAITDAAIAKMDLGERTGHLVIEGEPDGPKSLWMVFDKSDDQDQKLMKAKKK